MNKQQRAINPKTEAFLEEEVRVEGFQESLELEKGIVDNTQLLNAILKTLKSIDKSLIKIRD